MQVARKVLDGVNSLVADGYFYVASPHLHEAPTLAQGDDGHLNPPVEIPAQGEAVESTVGVGTYSIVLWIEMFSWFFTCGWSGSWPPSSILLSH